MPIAAPRGLGRVLASHPRWRKPSENGGERAADNPDPSPVTNLAPRGHHWPRGDDLRSGTVRTAGIVRSRSPDPSSSRGAGRRAGRPPGYRLEPRLLAVPRPRGDRRGLAGRADRSPGHADPRPPCADRGAANTGAQPFPDVSADHARVPRADAGGADGHGFTERHRTAFAIPDRTAGVCHACADGQAYAGPGMPRAPGQWRLRARRAELVVGRDHDRAADLAGDLAPLEIDRRAVRGRLGRLPRRARRHVLRLDFRPLGADRLRRRRVGHP